MSSTLSGRCWNPTAWCAACRDDCCGIETIRLLTARALQGGTLTGLRPEPYRMATRGAAVCPGSPPIGLAPFDPFMRSHQAAPGQPLATGLQIGTLGEPSAAEIEPRATCAHARRKRAHPPARASCARIHARTHAHTRTRIRARARFVLLSGRNLPAIRPFFYIWSWCDDAGEIPMVFGGVN